MTSSPSKGRPCAIVSGFGHGIDENDRPVERSKAEHPYSYDSFVQERCGPNSMATATAYTDRLAQQDPELTARLMAKHLNDGHGDWWDARPAAAIESFLRERLSLPSLKVVLVMECCNQATGNPYWRIDYAA